jgi:hypothetical protein
VRAQVRNQVSRILKAAQQNDLLDFLAFLDEFAQGVDLQGSHP